MIVIATDIRNSKRRLAPLLALVVLPLVLLAGLAPNPSDASVRGGIGPPPPISKGPITKVVPLAKIELGKRVIERRGDNVPRYRDGRGRIAPYSIGDAWCVAFATWIWRKAGFTDYLGADLLSRSFDRSVVAVQVRDLTRWAVRNNHWSYRAKPGHLVLYGDQHMGIVERINRTGRAVTSIEGNKSNRVRRVEIDMSRVTGYISPTALSLGQFVPAASSLADVD